MVEVSSCPRSVPVGGIVQNGLGSGRDDIVEVAVDPVELELSSCAAIRNDTAPDSGN